MFFKVLDAAQFLDNIDFKKYSLQFPADFLNHIPVFVSVLVGYAG